MMRVNASVVSIMKPIGGTMPNSPKFISFMPGGVPG